jgi:hypothetical protein
MDTDHETCKAELIEKIAIALMDMEFHAQAHIEAQRRVVALRAEYDEMMAPSGGIPRPGHSASGT